jgi:phospholipase D1/2
MYALSEMIDSAKEVIFIQVSIVLFAIALCGSPLHAQDWWLTPELYLRRPPADYPDWRLDRLLKRKAEQGVKIHVIVYKEVSSSASRHMPESDHDIGHPNDDDELQAYQGLLPALQFAPRSPSLMMFSENIGGSSP